MNKHLRPGDGIRLTAQVQDTAFLPGDRGVVLSGYQASAGGWLSYYVRMQGQSLGMWTIFGTQEIERDGEPMVRSDASRQTDDAAGAAQAMPAAGQLVSQT